MEPELLGALALVLAAGVITGWRVWQTMAVRRRRVAEDALEARLHAAADGTLESTEIEALLHDANVWVLVHPARPTVPVALALRSPEVLRVAGDEPVRVVESVPVILCCSSKAAVRRFAETPLGGAVGRNHTFVETTAWEVFAQALERGVRVTLNPEDDGTRTFGAEEISRLLDLKEKGNGGAHEPRQDAPAD